MPLQTLHLDSTPVRDLSALAGLPLKELRLDGCTELRDLTPLAKCTDLEVLTLPRDHGEIDFLRNLPKLKKLSLTGTILTLQNWSRPRNSGEHAA